MSRWSDLADHSPMPTVIIDPAAGDSAPPLIEYTNAAWRSLFGVPGAGQPFDEVIASESWPAIHSALSTPETLGGAALTIEARTHDPMTIETLTLHLKGLPDGRFIGQFARCDGWRQVDRVLDEEQRFRSALLELSEFAHVTEDDEEFYQRLIERAVHVVPGAQGGSVQLNIPGTATFRFVAAVGYDLAGLQRHVLEPEHFFRDAWDPNAQIVRSFDAEARSPEISEWLETVGRLSEIVVNVSAPVLSNGRPIAFLSLDNFEDPDALTATSVEMTTVLANLIGELWRRRELESALRTEREAYRQLALHDPLTGLANRRSLERALDRALEGARQHEKPTAVVFVDIDDFKGVNDRLGHQKGDALLTHVANGLAQAVRNGDMVGRWGGDEFLILPSRLTSPNEAHMLAERVLEFFETSIDLGDGLAHRARLSLGVGFSPTSQVDPDTLVRTADHALYDAKAAGKGTTRFREAPA